MPEYRFTPSGATRHKLTDGKDWVEFKNALSWGEQMRLTADYSVVETVTEAGENGKETTTQQARIDWGAYGPRRLLAYLVAWSFVGPDEKTPVPITLEMVCALDGATGAELSALLDKHLAEAALKNAPKSTPA